MTNARVESVNEVTLVEMQEYTMNLTSTKESVIELR